MQLVSTLTGQSIERPVQVEMSCLGAAFLAGLAAGDYNYQTQYENICLLVCVTALCKKKLFTMTNYWSNIDIL